jgi:hypothetical protein
MKVQLKTKKNHSSSPQARRSCVASQPAAARRSSAASQPAARRSSIASQTAGVHRSSLVTTHRQKSLPDRSCFYIVARQSSVVSQTAAAPHPLDQARHLSATRPQRCLLPSPWDHTASRREAVIQEQREEGEGQVQPRCQACAHYTCARESLPLPCSHRAHYDQEIDGGGRSSGRRARALGWGWGSGTGRRMSAARDRRAARGPSRRRTHRSAAGGTYWGQRGQGKMWIYFYFYVF